MVKYSFFRFLITATKHTDRIAPKKRQVNSYSTILSFSAEQIVCCEKMGSHHASVKINQETII